MRRFGVIISLVLTLLACAGMTFFTGSVFADSFKVDVSEMEVNEKYGILTLGDLGVGKFAYFNSLSFCRELSGEIKVLKDIIIADRRDDLSTYKVKRLPNNQVSIEIVAGELSRSEEERKSLIIMIVNGENVISCNAWNLLSDSSSTDWLGVNSIDGAKSAKELMRKAE
jgi:hypothetical protein